MKYLKKFENFDLGRFNNEDEKEDQWIEDVEEMEDEDCESCEDDENEEEDENTEEEEMRRRVWGDEGVVEKKKMNAGFQAYLDKQKAKKSKKDDKKDDKESKKSKKDDKKDDKESKGKGLTAAQKKLPEGLRKAIEKKKSKKKK